MGLSGCAPGVKKHLSFIMQLEKKKKKLYYHNTTIWKQLFHLWIELKIIWVWLTRETQNFSALLSVDLLYDYWYFFVTWEPIVLRICVFLTILFTNRMHFCHCFFSFTASLSVHLLVVVFVFHGHRWKQWD